MKESFISFFFLLTTTGDGWCKPTPNALGGFEDEYLAYTFSGKVQRRQQAHFVPGRCTQVEVHTYSYDHAERLPRVTYTGNKLTKVTDAATPSITYEDAFHFVDGANVATEYWNIIT